MRVLHLEMSQFFSSVIEKVLTSNGIEYLNARSVEAGLAALGEYRFDMIITSHILEDGRGEHFLEAIAETGKRDIPVVVITSDDSLETRERLFSLGVMDFLNKSEVVPSKVETYVRIINAGSQILEELKEFRVAVLDDSNVSLHVIRSIFNYYEVNHAEYFNSPRAMLEAGHFDLYIIDMVLPEMSGEQVLLEIKERNSRSGVIVVSGVLNRLTMAHTPELGADDYISKPFDAREFLARVKSVVRQLLLLRELEEKSRQMEEASRRDSLTGLWNHGAIHEHLEHELRNAEGRPVSVALFDLDNFKSVNDRHGHQTGDDVLMEAADILTGHSDAADEVGRYGGEEFMLVMPGTDRDEAVTRAEHLLAHLRLIDMGINNLKITSSCGVAVSTERDDSMQLVELADERLYAAKDAGKNQVIG